MRLSSLLFRRYSHLVTTPIYYANAAPHIGHVYTSVIADAEKRFRPDILFLKHDSSILRESSNPVCGFSMMEQVRLCAVWLK